MRRIIIVFLFCISVSLPVAYVSSAGLVPCDGPDCQSCDFLKLGQNIIAWIIKVMVPLCVLVISYAGFQMVISGGDESKRHHAKDMITNVIIGFIIILSAWLVVDTIMKTFVRGQLLGETSEFGPWNVIQCVEQPKRTTSMNVSTSGVSSGTGLNQQQVLSQLGGIKVVSSGQCFDRSQKNCTGLDGMQQQTIDTIIATSKDCSGCNLIVTAGTEVGHQNSCHVSGTCVDVKCNGGCSDTQIKQIITSAPNSGGTAIWEVKTAERMQQLINAGVPKDNIQVVNWITGEHASLYTKVADAKVKGKGGG